MTRKLLRDENMDFDLVECFPGYEVAHVKNSPWRGLKKGLLLSDAAGAGFSVIISVDKQMRHQHNMKGRPLAVIVLDNDPTSPRNQLACLPEILELVPSVVPGRIYIVAEPNTTRRRGAAG